MVSESSTRGWSKRELGGTDGRGTGGDQDRLGPQVQLVGAGGVVVIVVVGAAVPVAAVVGLDLGHDADRVGVEERGGAVVQDHAVAGEAALDRACARWP